MKIRSRSPVRIAFGGGGTDVPPFVENEGGAVLNATINRYAWTTLETDNIKGIEIISDDYSKKIFAPSKNELKKDGKLDLIKLIIHKMKHINNNFRIYLRSDVPPKSGLGGSGAAFSSVIGAFNHLLNEKRLSPYDIAEMAYELERNDMGIMGGCQDQYATVFGGINFFEFKAYNLAKITPLKLPKDIIYEFEKRLVLANTGDRTHDGTNILLDQVKSYDNNTNIQALNKTKEMAYEMKYALLKGDLDRLGELMNKAWEEKKKFSKYITNPKIDSLYDVAKKNGVIGGKITGAGGGGHMLFLCKENTEHKVARSLQANGCQIVPFSFDLCGLETWEVKNKN